MTTQSQIFAIISSYAHVENITAAVFMNSQQYRKQGMVIPSPPIEMFFKFQAIYYCTLYFFKNSITIIVYNPPLEILVSSLIYTLPYM